jgi:hypothetical protein
LGRKGERRPGRNRATDTIACTFHHVSQAQLEPDVEGTHHYRLIKN